MANELCNGQIKTQIVNPKVYIDYLKRFDYDVAEIEMVNDNGYGYEWEIRFFDKDNKYHIKSLNPIDMVEWLSEYYMKEYK